MIDFCKKLDRDETAGSTTEWLLVAGTSAFLFGTLGSFINLIISYIFIRSAIVVVTPFG